MLGGCFKSRRVTQVSQRVALVGEKGGHRAIPGDLTKKEEQRTKKEIQSRRAWLNSELNDD
jgi:hypothetical protein